MSLLKLETLRIKKTNKLSIPKAALLSAISVCSAQALAADSVYPDHHFGIYMRSDLQLNRSDSPTDLNSTGDSTKFKFNYLKLNFKGNLNEKTSYRVRFRLNKTLATSGKNDGSSPGADYAYIDRKINSSLKVRMGKQYFAGACGREGDYSGQDVYSYSTTCDLNPFYKTGVAVMPTYSNQTFVLSVVNPDDTSSNQSSLGYSATWYGNIADSMFEPIVAYIYFPLTEQKNGTTGAVTSESSTNSFFAMGTRFTKDKLQLEADYMRADIEARSAGASDQSNESVVLRARMFLMNGKLRPMVKYEVSNTDSTTAGKPFDRDAYTLALEYYPDHGQKGVDWRVHAAFTQSKDVFSGAGTPDLVNSQFLVGFSYNFTGG